MSQVGAPTIRELIAELCAAGGAIWLAGDEVRFRIPADAQAERRLRLLRERKAKVVECLRDSAGGQADRELGFPLSLGQEQLMFLQEGVGAGCAYNMLEAYAIHGPLDVAALGAAFEDLTARHHILRTRFVRRDERPRQIVEPQARDLLVVTDLASEDLPAKEARWREMVRLCAKTPFDLAACPPIQVRLCRWSPREQRLLICLHHILADGWSVGVLERDLSRLYTAHRLGEPTLLPELALQYGDFALDQRRRLANGAFQASVHYWTERLADLPHTLALPTDRPRSEKPTFRGGAVCLDLPKALARDLADFCRSRAVTLYVVMLSTYQLLLARLSGQTDFGVGSPVAGRDQPGLQDLIGYFVNVVVMRSELAQAGLTFEKLTARNSVAVAEALAHHDAPFAHVVAALNPARGGAGQPFFQAMLSVQAEDRPGLRLPGLTVEKIPLEVGGAKCDLALFVEGGGDGIALSLEYASDLFEPETASGILADLKRLLEDAVAHPSHPVERLGLSTRVEALRAEHGANGHRPDGAGADATACIHHLFMEAVSSNPEAPALLFGHERLSYGELDEHADRYAALLEEHGISPGGLVGLCMPRSPGLLGAILGIWKAGCAFVPLDPSYPGERLRHVVMDSGLSVVLTCASTHDLPVNAGVRRLALDEGFRPPPRPPATSARANLDPASLAYVIYTSGSTGTPKGVAVTHANIVNLARAQRRVVDAGPGDRVLQYASLNFDAAVLEILMALTNGAALVLAPQGLAPGAALSRFMRAEAITHAFMVPGILDALDPADLQACRKLLVGAEIVPTSLVRTWARGRSLHNAYGPTEAGIVTTYSHALDAADARAPIGSSIGNVEVHVLDDQLQPVPARVTGELFIGGAGLARGYLGRPGMTAERFLPNPFGPPGSRLYRTGDLVRRHPNGELEYVSRADRQIKLRGHRIELAEIEAVLGELPGVRQVAVEVRNDPARGLCLVAYWTARQEGGADAAALRRRAGRQLPRYMAPAIYVELASFPLTPNGKIDRAALPAPDVDAVSTLAFQAPRGDAETHLAAIWSELLGVARVGRNDGFFELGGHSLLLAQLVARVNAAFGADLDLRRALAASTVADMAEQIATAPSFDLKRRGIVLRRDAEARDVIYFMPSIVGLGTPYGELARALRLRAEMQALLLPGLEPGEAACATIEAMAAACLRQILPGQPRRVSLIGWSFGGLIANALALQLQARGEAPHRVILIDSYARANPSPVSNQPWRDFVALLAPDGEASDEVGACGPQAEAFVALEACFQAQSRPIVDARSLYQLYLANLQALQAYAATSIYSDLSEIRALQTVAGLSDPLCSVRPLKPDWNSAFGIEGDHYSIMSTDHIEDVARMIEALIQAE